MLARSERTGLRGLRALLDCGTVAGRTDGQLLERFALGPGEAADLAFSALVDRHGAMVLRTCRAVLRDEHAAEDAFQETFATLARRGRSLWVRESVGPWLHRVAFRRAIRERGGRSASPRGEERRRGEAGASLGRSRSPRRRFGDP